MPVQLNVFDDIGINHLPMNSGVGSLNSLWLPLHIYIYIYIYIYRNIYIYIGYKHFTLIDEKTSIPLSVRGAYIATTTPYLYIWCLQYFPLIQRNRHTPLPYNLPARFSAVPRGRPGYHPGHGTTCSGYKHFTLIDEKTSIPLSARGAYIATTAPYLNIWCLQYFPLIQRRQRNRNT